GEKGPCRGEITAQLETASCHCWESPPHFDSLRRFHETGPMQDALPSFRDAPEDGPIRRVARRRWTLKGVHVDQDEVVVEEPLEIRVGTVPIAVVMRTPGDDMDLTYGFVLTE